MACAGELKNCGETGSYPALLWHEQQPAQLRQTSMQHASEVHRTIMQAPQIDLQALTALEPTRLVVVKAGKLAPSSAAEGAATITLAWILLDAGQEALSELKCCQQMRMQPFVLLHKEPAHIDAAPLLQIMTTITMLIVANNNDDLQRPGLHVKRLSTAPLRGVAHRRGTDLGTVTQDLTWRQWFFRPRMRFAAWNIVRQALREAKAALTAALTAAQAATQAAAEAVLAAQPGNQAAEAVEVAKRATQEALAAAQIAKSDVWAVHAVAKAAAAETAATEAADAAVGPAQLPAQTAHASARPAARAAAQAALKAAEAVHHAAKAAKEAQAAKAAKAAQAAAKAAAKEAANEAAKEAKAAKAAAEQPDELRTSDVSASGTPDQGSSGSAPDDPPAPSSTKLQGVGEAVEHSLDRAPSMGGVWLGMLQHLRRSGVARLRSRRAPRDPLSAQPPSERSATERMISILGSKGESTGETSNASMRRRHSVLSTAAGGSIQEHQAGIPEESAMSELSLSELPGPGDGADASVSADAIARARTTLQHHKGD